MNLERNVDNIYVRRKHFDLFLETNIGKIQVEVNAEDPNYLHSRNASFVFDTYSHEVKRGEEYTEDTLVIQINLSYSIKIEELVRNKEIVMFSLFFNTICFLLSLEIKKPSLRRAFTTAVSFILLISIYK